MPRPNAPVRFSVSVRVKPHNIEPIRLWLDVKYQSDSGLGLDPTDESVPKLALVINLKIIHLQG